MSDPKELKDFVRHVLIAARKREEKEEERASLQEQVKEVKKIAGEKRVDKSGLLDALKELDSKLNSIFEKEGSLILAAEREHRDSESVKGQIRRLEGDVRQLTEKDIALIDLLKNQIAGLERELRVTEIKRAQEVTVSKSRIKEIKDSISELRERINCFIEKRAERERRIMEMEDNLKKEAEDSRSGIEKIESELAELRRFEEREHAPKKKVGFFEIIGAALRKRPKPPMSVRPEVKEIFRENLPMPLPASRAVVVQRPVVKHDIIFGEIKAQKSIPMKEERPAMPLPPIPEAPHYPYAGPGIPERMLDIFKKKKTL